MSKSNNNKEEFIQIYKENITREGADTLLEYLLSSQSDFFKAPASTRYHGAYEGGLCEHSLNVYHCLCDYLTRERTKKVYGMNYSGESVALTALLHDICKLNFYKKERRNRKNDYGQWEEYDYYSVEDKLPYGHGEKSVYIVSGFMKLSRPESFAIRYHMGFSGTEDKNSIGAAFEMYPLALALSVADMEASYYLEGSKQQ
ncbi:MAG: HD domain-containing protein [Ruminococcus sp.]|nr:HD domain-containing protein [Ruminococcus sp.]